MFTPAQEPGRVDVAAIDFIARSAALVPFLRA